MTKDKNYKIEKYNKTVENKNLGILRILDL